MTGLANWKNQTLFHGDNSTFLRAMNSESVDLIATDPRSQKWKRRYGAFSGVVDRDAKPEIGRFAGSDLVGAFKQIGVTVSMDGRGRVMHNIFIKRLWRSLKFETAPKHDLTDGFRARRVIGDRFAFHNVVSPHSSLGDRVPAGARIPTGSTAAPENDAWKSGGMIRLEYGSKCRRVAERTERPPGTASGSPVETQIDNSMWLFPDVCKMPVWHFERIVAFTECCANAAGVCARIKANRMSFLLEPVLQE